jgi:hypothetical protein
MGWFWGSPPPPPPPPPPLISLSCPVPAALSANLRVLSNLTAAPPSSFHRRHLCPQDTHCGTIGARCCSGCAKAVFLLPVLFRCFPRPHPDVCAATPVPSYATQAHGAKNSTVANRRSNSCVCANAVSLAVTRPHYLDTRIFIAALCHPSICPHAFSPSGVKRIWVDSRFRAWTLGTRLWRTAAPQCCCETPVP